MANDEKAGAKQTLQFVKSRGSQVTGRHKEKRERIHEAMCDLQLALNGIRGTAAQPEKLDPPEPLHPADHIQQSSAALARACSIFLRKMVLGDRQESKTRLLDDEISRSLGFKFPRVRKISPSRLPLDIVALNSNGGMFRAEKLDEATSLPESVYTIPIPPHQFKISIEWPLPGMTSWTDSPTMDKPWVVCPEELFDTDSGPTLNCDAWLGQQLVMFDNTGIALKEVITTVATYEGAHSINVSRLSQTENETNYKPANRPDLHILNNLKIFGIKYSHIILMETALYLYDELLKHKEIERPKGAIYLVKPAFVEPADAFSHCRSWLAYDGGIMLSFGHKPQLISHRIRAVR